MYAFVSILLLALVVAALVDIITRNDAQIRHLPRLVWVLLVVFLPLIGSIVWFAVGHEWAPRRAASPSVEARRSAPLRQNPPQSSPPSSTEAQLAALEAEIAADRAERIRQLEAELQAKKRGRPASDAG